MANEPAMTVIGNLTDDPELRYTPSGAAVAKFRIASTPRTFDKQTSEWRDGEPLFLTCNIWRDPAEHAAESLKRGTRVIVHGRLRQRSYETREGEKRTVYELEVDEIGPSLRYATTTVKRMTRTSTPPATTTAASAGQGDDPWSVPASTAAPASGGSFDDEPPF